MAKEKVYSGSMASRIFAGDKVMWVVLVVLLVYSLFLVYSNMAYDSSKSASQELIRQILFICIGMTGFYTAQAMSIKFYKRIVVPFLLISLGLTFYMILSHSGGGAARSLNLFGLEFQPFEFLKFAIVINLARQLSTRQKQMESLRIMPSFRIADWREDKESQLEILRTQTLPILGPIALCCLITVKFSNSTTLIIAASSLAMMFLSRVHKSDIGKIIVVGLLVGGLALVIYGSQGSRSGTAVSRVSSWTPNVLSKSVGVGKDGKEYYKRHEQEHDQTLYAKMSIATGGLVGKGPGQSTNRYLAEADKDMAFAFLIEEYGLLFGGLVMLFAYLLMFYRSMVIFLKCGTAFPGLMVLGIGTVIVLQAFLHMMVCVSLFPLTGQQLPIVSKGGTSLVLTLSMLGMLMGVSAKAEN
ncbi:MAG: FtsW/RodA/SpoVE family cell cycle protein [Tidjanibacter sp.]|nr:FtsW/RodA/SpoVE family cell cycle protein [Tidjanibacter sp.]